MSRSIMVVFASAECGNDEPQTNADGRGADACAEEKEQKSKEVLDRINKIDRIYRSRVERVDRVEKSICHTWLPKHFEEVVGKLYANPVGAVFTP